MCTGLSLYLWPPGFWVWLRNIIDHPHLPKGGKAPRPMTAAVRIQKPAVPCGARGRSTRHPTEAPLPPLDLPLLSGVQTGFRLGLPAHLCPLGRP